MLRKTVLSLKSPTGAFIAPLRCANANLFNKVQEKLAKNKKAPARHKAEESYLLTTKLYCGKCGALMFGESGVSHTGKMYTYYKCAAAKKKKTCDKKAVRKQWLEDLVVNETMKLVEDDASMNAIIAKVMELQNQESTDLPIYEKQLKETEVGITNMLNAIQMGILTSSTEVHPVPKEKTAIDRTMTLGELNHSRSPLCWLISGVLTLLLRSGEKRGKPNLNILFQYNMPLRGLAQMTGGISMVIFFFGNKIIFPEGEAQKAN